jgi:hypothetical protein
MRNAIDHHPARSTDSFPAIVFEGNRFATCFGNRLVHEIEHVQEGHVWRDVTRFMTLEGPWSPTGLLSPDMQSQVHL